MMKRKKGKHNKRQTNKYTEKETKKKKTLQKICYSK